MGRNRRNIQKLVDIVVYNEVMGLGSCSKHMQKKQPERYENVLALADR